MKKRLLSILLMCCMVLTLLPTTAFAEGGTEEPLVCTCETACTAESMNASCTVCGAEDALPENCAKREVSAPQPEAALTALSGEGETPAASGEVTDVSTADELTKAIADSAVKTVRLAGNISISSSLTVTRTVTLDLNGHVLQMTGNDSDPVIEVKKDSIGVGIGNLTLTDSNTAAEHKFMPGTNGLWVLNENGSETVSGGVITGGTGYPYPLSSTLYCGGGVYIAPGGQLTMTGGNIIGCSAEFGGGVCIYPRQGAEASQFSMSGGSIIGCVASHCGGGVYASGKFQMSGKAVIRNCTVESTDQLIHGGGVYVDGSFEMSGDAKIEGCQAISSSAYGGGVYVNSSRNFVMSDAAKIEYCQAISKSSNSSKGGGVYLSNNTEFTLSGSAVIQKCTAKNSATPGIAYGGGVSAANVREITLADSARIAGCAAANGSGLYITGVQKPRDGKLYANGGSVEGDVVLGDHENYPCTITGTGKTEFKGKVTVAPGSTIKSGTFNGEVTNNGTITGGTFNGEVINNGTINDGVFTGIVSDNGKINGGTFNPLITGSGTVTDPYRIRTAEGLKWFRDKVNSATKTADTQICAELTEDIDLSGEEWTPIGIGQSFHWGIRSYSGTFDGKGHTIKNLSIDNSSANFVGLFGYVYGGTIRNLTVSGSVKGSGHTGGIAGGADGGTFENCANLCVVQSDSTEGGTTGGIIGFALNMDHELIVRDCYNVGSITGRHAGGIIGQCSWHETISNCYNAGTVTGTANAGAIIGSYSSDKISNCYYLDGSVIRKGRGDKASIAKTATEFANGTVRELLKAGERDSNADPWADECKYLDAAGKTLPVFKGQGDAHEHNGNWTSNGDGTHSRRCTCNAVETVNCSGGTATCTAKAKCADCGAEYGDTNLNHHGDKLKHVVAKDATTSEEGNIEYWYCEACEKYFSDADAKNEITQAQTVIPKRQSSGSSASYCTLTFESNGGSEIESVHAARHTRIDLTSAKYEPVRRGYIFTGWYEDKALTKKLTSIELMGSRTVYAGWQPDTMHFDDVRRGDWFYDDAAYVYANGLMSGTSAYRFSPDLSTTRAMIVTILWRLEGEPVVNFAMRFADVSPDKWYGEAIRWAAASGIVNGYSAFGPNDNITREQLAAMLYRYAQYKKADVSVGEDTNILSFDDAFDVSGYAVPAMQWACGAGVMQGANGKLLPTAEATRAQTAAMLHRFCEDVLK